jgi:prepilin-type N-terminal cleavage/methylation domain-containing protein
MSAHSRPARDDGFSLIEVVVAMSLLMVGLLGLAQVFYFGLAIVGTSSAQLIAREKAREAIESVHTARDTRVITWAQIRNVSAPACLPAWGANLVGNFNPLARFKTEEHPLLAAGPDGLVATNDDVGQEMTPGPDNTLGTADDVPLVGFRRQIAICDVTGNANLRLIAVTISYPGSSAVGLQRRTYTLITYVSSFS